MALISSGWILAIDTERKGDDFSAHLNGIGLYFMPRSGMEPSTHIKRDWGLKPRVGDTESQETMTNFWNNHPAALAYLEDKAVPAAVGLAEFYETLAVLDAAAGDDEIVIVSDNQEIDLGWVAQRARDCGLTNWPLQFFRSGGCRCKVIDSNQRLKQLGVYAESDFHDWLRFMAPTVGPTHQPGDDAENAAWKLVFCESRLVISHPKK